MNVVSEASPQGGVKVKKRVVRFWKLGPPRISPMVAFDEDDKYRLSLLLLLLRAHRLRMRTTPGRFRSHEE